MSNVIKRNLNLHILFEKILCDLLIYIPTWSSKVYNLEMFSFMSEEYAIKSDNSI